MIGVCFFFSSRRRHTRCALVTGVQTCALPILDEQDLTAADDVLDLVTAAKRHAALTKRIGGGILVTTAGGGRTAARAILALLVIVVVIVVVVLEDRQSVV